MSYRCQRCQTLVPRGTRAIRLVVESRAKVYASRGQRRDEGRGFRPRFGGFDRQPHDKGGEGHEIVRELIVCPKCAELSKASEPVSDNV